MSASAAYLANRWASMLELDSELERGNDRARGGISMGVVAKAMVINAKLFV